MFFLCWYIVLLEKVIEYLLVKFFVNRRNGVLVCWICGLMVFLLIIGIFVNDCCR